jgi:hypothetical protein
MPDVDPNKLYADTRASLRDTAKWIVTILGATVVLVIGGGLIAKVADLDTISRLIAASCLLILTLVCLIPLKSAIQIVATKLTPLNLMAQSPEYATARGIVNDWLTGHYPPIIDTVEKLYQVYREKTAIANNPAATDRAAAITFLGELQPRIKEIIEITNTEYLRLKFDDLVRRTTATLPIVGIALFGFLMTSHKDDETEKALKKPVFLQIAWSADIEAALKNAGLEPKCFVKKTPHLLQLSEKSGLRAGVLVIPQDLGFDCPAVRVVVTNANKMYPAD